MRLLLLLTALLLAAPCRAQLSLPEDGLRSFHQASAALAKSKKASAPSVLDAKQKKSLDALVDRLIKDGTTVEHQLGLLHAFQKTEAAANLQRQVTVGLVEVNSDPNEGVIAGEPGSGQPVLQDLVERHTYSHLESQVMIITANADGTATIDSRIYLVSLDGRVMGAVSQTGTFKIDAKGEVDIDPAQLKTAKLAPAAAKPAWDTLLPELLKMGKVVEI